MKNISLGRVTTEAPVSRVVARLSTWGGSLGGRPWRRKRDAILLRDHYQCQVKQEGARAICGTYGDEVDHIIPRSQGGSNEDTNLRAICSDCHVLKTGLEARADHSNAGGV